MKTLQQVLIVGHFLFSFQSFAQSDFDQLKARLSGKVAGAHQGGIFQNAANTIKQFEAAKKSGMDIVEMDLRITKDGIAVVFHDETLETWTNCNGYV